jgi:hypothetical protein
MSSPVYVMTNGFRVESTSPAHREREAMGRVLASGDVNRSR